MPMFRSRFTEKKASTRPVAEKPIRNRAGEKSSRQKRRGCPCSQRKSGSGNGCGRMFSGKRFPLSESGDVVAGELHRICPAARTDPKIAPLAAGVSVYEVLPPLDKPIPATRAFARGFYRYAVRPGPFPPAVNLKRHPNRIRSEEHTSELQSQ